VNYLWYLIATAPTGSMFENLSVLFVYLVLFILLDICLLRDIIINYFLDKTKEFDDILLFLLLGLLIQVIISAILPASNAALAIDTEKLLYFYLPNVHSTTVNGGLGWNSTVQIGFQIAATLMVLLIIVPMILDIKDEELPLPVIFIITLIFILPFLFLSFIWLPAAAGVLTFLMCLILFIVLLIITKSGHE
jgi:hypothetical protein